MSSVEMMLLILGGPLSVLVAVIGTLRIAPSRHIIGALVAGAFCLIPGYIFGVNHFCFDGAGNLCGLAAILGTAPCGFAIGTLGYAVLSRLLWPDRRVP